MKKRILLPTDGSPASQHALDYVGMMEGARIKDLEVCLYYVMKPIPSFMRQEAKKDPKMHQRVAVMERKNTQEAREVLDGAKERLLERGMREEAIETKGLPKAADTTRDIIFEAEHGMYDAVVLGSRGLSKAQGIFMSSVTNKVLQHTERIPVWVVGGRVSSMRVLAAVDGSDGSLRAIDHMAFMLGDNPDCEITLFHVGAALSNYCTLDFGQDMAGEIEGHILESEQRCMADFHARAQKVLVEAGLERSQINTMEVEGRLGVTRAIVEEAIRGDYGTVVLGRRGEHKSFFIGHVADKVAVRLEQHAVWVVG